MNNVFHQIKSTIIGFLFLGGAVWTFLDAYSKETAIGEYTVSGFLAAAGILFLFAPNDVINWVRGRLTKEGNVHKDKQNINKK